MFGRMIQCRILVFDGVPEGADEFVVGDFNGKDLVAVISLDEAIQFEDRNCREVWMRH